MALRKSRLKLGELLVKEGLITLNDIVRTIKAKSRDTNVWISMAPDTGTMLRMLEYWPALSELLASE